MYRVDGTTGARTTVSDNTSAGQPNFAWPHGIVSVAQPWIPRPEPVPFPVDG